MARNATIVIYGILVGGIHPIIMTVISKVSACARDLGNQSKSFGSAVRDLSIFAIVIFGILFGGIHPTIMTVISKV